MARFRIGTASWTDPGFIEDWYPQGLPASRRLRWYAEHFNYVEVNATFYSIPAARTAERWCLETPDDFLFDVKLPKVLSRHAMQAKFLPSDLRAKIVTTSPQRNAAAQISLTPETQRLITERLLRELQPLFEAKKFGTFLLQMSPSFSPRNKNQLVELDSIGNALAPHPLAVELRNRDWVTGEQLESTLDYFRDRSITFVMVDAPESEHFTIMPGLNAVTNPKLAYFRLHGRNAEGYIKGRSVPERFNYNYPPHELQQIEKRVRDVAGEADEIHIAANNNRSSFAPRTAEWLVAALLGKAEQKPAESQSDLPFLEESPD